MAKKNCTDSIESPPTAQPSSEDLETPEPSDRFALIDAIETEREKIVRARTITQLAARLLHEQGILERNEPDLGFVLDVVADLLEHALGGLDRITASNL